jgi:toxin YoeB
VTITFTRRAWDQYLAWQGDDPKTLKKLNDLIKECSRTPFAGSGKPEPLRGDLKGWWSRRITQEHRLVYRMTERGLEIAQCRYHYG